MTCVVCGKPATRTAGSVIGVSDVLLFCAEHAGAVSMPVIELAASLAADAPLDTTDTADARQRGLTGSALRSGVTAALSAACGFTGGALGAAVCMSLWGFAS